MSWRCPNHPSGVSSYTSPPLCLYQKDIHARTWGDTYIAPFSNTIKESINSPLRRPFNVFPLKNSSVLCRIILVPATFKKCTQQHYHISNLNTITIKSYRISLVDKVFAVIDSDTVLSVKNNISYPSRSSLITISSVFSTRFLKSLKFDDLYYPNAKFVAQSLTPRSIP